jgi:sugar transferase EpsL
MIYRTHGKRLFDLIFVLVSLVFVSPFFLVIVLAMRCNLGAPVLFSQRRAGLHGRVLILNKFRTMTDEYDSVGNLMPDEQRLTRFGKFLRSTSLDELPELFNVLKGDMSIVGPRPLLVQYLDRYTPEQTRRHEVKPGITGWAQVNGRNAISWEEKFRLDVWYVNNQSFWLDLKIIWLTLWKIVKREGINQAGQATMEEFCGYTGKD